MVHGTVRADCVQRALAKLVSLGETLGADKSASDVLHLQWEEGGDGSPLI